MLECWNVVGCRSMSDICWTGGVGFGLVGMVEFCGLVGIGWNVGMWLTVGACRIYAGQVELGLGWE